MSDHVTLTTLEAARQLSVRPEALTRLEAAALLRPIRSLVPGTERRYAVADVVALKRRIAALRGV